MQRSLTQTEHYVFRISSCASHKKWPSCFSYIIHPFTVNSAGIKILRSLPGRANVEKVGFERQRKKAGVQPSSTTRGRSDAFCISHKLLHLLQKIRPSFPSMIYPFTVSCEACPAAGGPTPRRRGSNARNKGSTKGGSVLSTYYTRLLLS